MKLSELTTDRALDVLCELTPAVANIVEDKAVASALERAIPEKKEDPEKEESASNFSSGLKIFGEIGRLAPVLLKNHRRDVYTILSVVNERPVEEISAQPLMNTVRQVREMLRDSDLLAFFKPSAQGEKTASSVPSAESPALE